METDHRNGTLYPEVPQPIRGKATQDLTCSNAAISQTRGSGERNLLHRTTWVSLGSLLLGSLLTASLFGLLGAAGSEEVHDRNYRVSLETIDLGTPASPAAPQLAIQITDLARDKAFVYLAYRPRKQNHGYKDPVAAPPRLMMTIDLTTAGKEQLSADISPHFLPSVEPTNFMPPVNPDLAIPNRTLLPHRGVTN